jgi:hypothetical protein
MNPVPDTKKARHIYRGGGPQQPSLVSLALRWIVTITVCLSIWGVLSPLIYEYFFMDLHRGGDGWGIIQFALCVIAPLLLISVSSTRRVVLKAKDEYFLSVNNSTLPAQQILVRGAAEPSAPNETLLRAGVKGEETKAEELLRNSQGH